MSPLVKLVKPVKLAVAAAMALTIAACAQTPPPVADYPPPAKRGFDAKTQLETGRRY